MKIQCKCSYLLHFLKMQRIRPDLGYGRGRVRLVRRRCAAGGVAEEPLEDAAADAAAGVGPSSCYTKLLSLTHSLSISQHETKSVEQY